MAIGGKASGDADASPFYQGEVLIMRDCPECLESLSLDAFDSRRAGSMCTLCKKIACERETSGSALSR